MLFGQGCFQLRVDDFNAFNLVKIIEVSAVPADELRKHKLSVCGLSRFFAFLAPCFVIVAANDDCLVRKPFFCDLGNCCKIVYGES